MWNVTCAKVSKAFWFIFSFQMIWLSGKQQSFKDLRHSHQPAGREDTYCRKFLNILVRGTQGGKADFLQRQRNRNCHGWGLLTFSLDPQIQPRIWPQEGDEWLDTFRRAQVHSNCSVKASLTTLHRITDLKNGGNLVLYSLYKRENRGTEQRDDLFKVTR